MFQTLAQPNRLQIVELLYNSPHTVNEISLRLKLNQPQTSKHLRVLADAGIVDVTPVANKRVYALKSKPFQELDSWLEKYRSLWNDRFNRLDTILETMKRR